MESCGVDAVWHVCLSANCLINWADEWQTMIAGGAALSAALIAARISHKQLKTTRIQIADDREQHARDRTGRLRAARASLPATLSTICDYGEQAARILEKQWPAESRLYPDDENWFREFGVAPFAMPTFPESAIPVLERIVELTDNEAISERIQSILREVQVLVARTKPMEKGRMLTPHNLATYILQAAAVYARAESLFGYARMHSDQVDAHPLWDRVSVALTAADIHNDYITEMMRQESIEGLPPGEADTKAVY